MTEWTESGYLLGWSGRRVGRVGVGRGVRVRVGRGRGVEGGVWEGGALRREAGVILGYRVGFVQVGSGQHHGASWDAWRLARLPVREEQHVNRRKQFDKIRQ